MKRLFKQAMLLVVAATTFATAACSDGDDGPETAYYTLEATPASITDFVPEGEMRTLKITADIGWNLTIEYTGEERDWLEASSTSGNGNRYIDLEAAMNRSEKAREAVVNLATAEGTIAQRIEILQQGYPVKEQYAVGDIYARDGKFGKVFFITDGGRHGKIFSYEQSGDIFWSTENVETGATDEDYGMNNQLKIQQIEGWYEKYPAFAWCADQGEEWYLPAKNELVILDQSGQDIAYGIDYWSSTEYDAERAWYVSIYTATVGYFHKTEFREKVRAVSEF